MDAGHYRDLRGLAAQVVTEGEACQDLDFDIREICEGALGEQDRWQLPPLGRRRVDWDWRHLVHRYRRQYPGRLDMALWSGNTLCGLALGKPSDGKLIVRVGYVEGAPEDHELQGNVFKIVDAYLEAYALALDIPYVSLQGPLSEVIPHYESFGYTLEDPFDPRNYAMTRSVGALWLVDS